MNGSHLHLLINHVPIVGVWIGLLVLLVGLLLKRNQVKNTALFIFIGSACTAIVAFLSGEGAEGIIGNLPTISETLIHKHEEYAELFFTILLILGGVSSITIGLSHIKSKFAKYGFLLVLLLSIGSVGISKYVGTSGGVITHIEIRNDTEVIKVN